MQSANQNLESEGKQFRLVKFFAWASFIVVVIFSFPFSMVISQKAKEILLASYENNAILVCFGIGAFGFHILTLGGRRNRG